MIKKVTKGFVWFFLLTLAVPVVAAGDGHGFDVTKFIAKVVNFSIFFGFLYYVLRKPVGSFFSERLRTIQDNLKLAEKSREEAKQQLDEIQAKMADLDTEIAQIEANAKAEAEKEKIRIREDAQKEAVRIVENAKAEVASMKERAIGELKAYVSQIALDEAEAIIRDTINDADRKRIFKGFSEKLEAEA